MNRIALVALAGLALCLVATAPVALAQQNTVTVNPGLVGPSNPFYPVDVAFDNFLLGMSRAMPINLTTPGKIVHERASEAYVATQHNDPRARQRALQNLNRVAWRATNQSTRGLQKARAVLGACRQRVEKKGGNTQGLDTAIDKVERAMERHQHPMISPATTPNPNSSSSAPTFSR